jgi:hypothetical protein
LAVFFIELYVLFASGGEFIILILFASLMTPSIISFLDNVSIEVFDTFSQLLVGVS